ncbi:MAG: hypothetical protein ACOVSR_08950 [Bacteroidia bacterium]
MKYQEYIQLGFERTDIEDQVEIKNSGYGGFFLKKGITDKITIEVYSSELDNPKMYISKINSETCHIISLTNEMIRDLFGTADNDYCGVA